MNESGRNLSRREFFTKGVSWGGLALGSSYFAYVAKESYEAITDGWEYENIKAYLNPAPWGGKCTIVYEEHTTLTENSRIAADIVTLEGVLPVDIPDDVLAEAKEKLASSEEEDRVDPDQYVLEENSNIWNVDVPIYYESLNFLLSTGIPLSFFKIVIGLSGILGIQGDHKLLKGGIYSYLLAESATYANAYMAIASEEGRSLASVTQKVNEALPNNHADYFILFIRNIIAAEKNEHLARIHQATSEQPIDLVSVWGAGHGGIETEILRNSEERISTLRKALSCMKEVFPLDHPYMWSCEKLDPQTKEKIGEVEVPSLKALFTEA